MRTGIGLIILLLSYSYFFCSFLGQTDWMSIMALAFMFSQYTSIKWPFPQYTICQTNQFGPIDLKDLIQSGIFVLIQCSIASRSYGVISLIVSTIFAYGFLPTIFIFGILFLSYYYRAFLTGQIGSLLTLTSIGKMTQSQNALIRQQQVSMALRIVQSKSVIFFNNQLVPLCKDIMFDYLKVSTDLSGNPIISSVLREAYQIYEVVKDATADFVIRKIIDKLLPGFSETDDDSDFSPFVRIEDEERIRNLLDLGGNQSLQRDSSDSDDLPDLEPFESVYKNNLPEDHNNHADMSFLKNTKMDADFDDLNCLDECFEEFKELDQKEKKSAPQSINNQVSKGAAENKKALKKRMADLRAVRNGQAPRNTPVARSSQSAPAPDPSMMDTANLMKLMENPEKLQELTQGLKLDPVTGRPNLSQKQMNQLIGKLQ